ncbi:MAG: NAD(P)/FAD-dependent oxidoreductase [Patescibacteria group bacterium]|nr:NAD(P)/FAD-dependent oxidoreductase [Patescibacteria group bacterium]MDD4610416.1 NAD(P)/FAD-dependent oxidoreductase [Patescibacteria group bacterium]
MIYDVAIIGGGPAGMMAAARASERGTRVVLLEKNNFFGKKLLLTGHGRCNLTNLMADKKEMLGAYGRNGKFLIYSFKKFGVSDTLNFFTKLGLATKVEDNGRVFPQSNKAADVRDVFLKYLKLKKVDLLLGVEAKEIISEKGEIKKVVLRDGREIVAKNFIISTGGKAYPETGSTGDAYKWLIKLGHTIIKPRPALVPIVVKEKMVKSLEGLSLENVQVSVYRDNKKITSKIGEIIFTADGLSGPLILNLSSLVGSLLSDSVTLKLDFLPEVSAEDLKNQLQKDFHHSNNKMLKNYLSGVIAPKLAAAIMKLTGVDKEKKITEISKSERQSLAEAIKGLNFGVIGLKDFDKAMLTAGGVNVKEINPRTMNSKIYKNLFLAGEILDLDGPTGGYNLQLCWSMGYMAGDSIEF